ncbi:MAG: thioredoxin family protein [Gammaproteobacteria bacterium]|nr:thioredoxin family protein [Gammaproteobacteria bacterium]
MFVLDESRYHPHLLETGGVSLVMFSSPACGSCRVVEKRLPPAVPEGTHLFKVDVQKATGLARAFDIFHLPTLFLYRDGHFHARLDCEITAPALRAAMAQLLALPPEEEP